VVELVVEDVDLQTIHLLVLVHQELIQFLEIQQTQLHQRVVAVAVQDQMVVHQFVDTQEQDFQVDQVVVEVVVARQHKIQQEH
tara:strand:- start:266 stop:514 length:249 start_codon:yes stop_codon:yes gene_type:complete